MIVCFVLHRVPIALEAVAPMATGHDDSEHLLVAYGVVLLRYRQAPGQKDNRVLLAFT